MRIESKTDGSSQISRILIGITLLSSHFYIPFSPRIYIWYITFSVIALYPVKAPQAKQVQPAEKLLRVGIALWILGALLSSRVNSLDLKSSIILVMNPITVLSAIVAFKKIIFAYEFSIYKLLIFVSVSGGVSEFLFRTPLSSYNLWKFGVGLYVTLFAFTLSAMKVNRNSYYIIFVIAISLFSFVFKARSLFGMTLLALFILLPLRRRNRPFSPDLKVRSSVKFAKIGLILFLIYVAYDSLASRGYLGEFELKRVQILNSTLGPLAGRSEFLFSVPIFLEKPVFGFGAVENISGELITGLAFKASQYVKLGVFAEAPIHSFLMETIVLVGILGLAFWLFYLFFTLRNLRYLDLQNKQVQDPVVFLTLWTTWGIFFSPLNSNERLMLGLLAVLILHSKAEATFEREDLSFKLKNR